VLFILRINLFYIYVCYSLFLWVLVAFVSIYNIITNRRVSWLDKDSDSGLVTGFIRFDYSRDRSQSLERVSSTALVVHLDQLLQQILLSSVISLHSSGTSGSTHLPRPTKRLCWLGSWNASSSCLLRAGTRPALELPFNSSTASHCSLQLLLNVLFCSVLWDPGSGLKCPCVDRKEITDRPCWSVIIRYCKVRIRNECRIRGYVPVSGYFEACHNMFIWYLC
jgi:hypothetical protein